MANPADPTSAEETTAIAIATPSTSEVQAHTQQTTPTGTTTSTPPAATSPAIIFPKSYSFPPFFTLQPTAQTRHAQLVKWSALTQRYCRHHRQWKLRLPDALATPLFHNKELNKRLSLRDARAVIDFMASKQGDERAEWVASTDEQKLEAWIWWRRPEEWGNLIADWVEGTGQKGVVLTLYELVEGQETEGQEFWGLDAEVLRRGLAALVKKGRAQVFGAEDQMGVKFF
ncbi:hypothetical protein G647_06070 [Cladophialophora carrionii CBS 160.54]|uniref:Vacuolar protein-sorting-associated protein 25 n=1 Tax=Cladophialophora carrionii CBS 160.54 TaxID=1279043 RepID=V9D554_9EURO|nr:uncharacterized protein G647_06070 [Cladophialophora carrionii CBS 160.54]ETI22000.1 hypothetical protein G647_06070 [Cladophialophora carrionii CBS 160.54]